MTAAVPFTIVFLAGGTGSRMGCSTPKQYLPINQKELALYSFEVLISLPEAQECVVVCAPEYEALFTAHSKNFKGRLYFARPGSRRQDSVWNGIHLLSGNPLVCIHDAARPLIDSSLVRRVVCSAEECGAAALGVRARSTIKICDENQTVVNTPDRNTLWEIQTPQVVRLDLLKEGFRYARENHCTVTDDLSLVELLGKPVQVVESSYANIKVTTPEDLVYVEQLIHAGRVCSVTS